MKKKSTILDGMSYVYKVSFEDGKVYYQRAADCWSVNSYRNHLLSLYHNESRNTEFEKKFFTEKSTAKISIVFKGRTEEAIEVKNRLVNETPNVMNTKVSGNLNHKSVKPMELKKEFTKVITSPSGDKLFYIEKDYGYRMALNDKMDGYKKHPLNPNFVLLNVFNVERV